MPSFRQAGGRVTGDLLFKGVEIGYKPYGLMISNCPQGRGGNKEFKQGKEEAEVAAPIQFAAQSREQPSSI